MVKRHVITDDEYIRLVKLRDSGATYDELRVSRNEGTYGAELITNFLALYNILRGIQDKDLQRKRITELFTSGKISTPMMRFGIKFVNGDIDMALCEPKESRVDKDNTAIVVSKMLDAMQRVATAAERCALRVDRLDDRLATIIRRVESIEQMLK